MDSVCALKRKNTDFLGIYLKELEATKTPSKFDLRKVKAKGKGN